MQQETERYYQTLIENVNDLLQVVHADGTVKYSSNLLESLVGYTQEEAKQLPPFTWIHPEDRERIAQQFEAQIKSDFKYYRVQYRLVTKQGAIKHVETQVTNALHNPVINGFIATVRDITNRVAAEEKVSKQRQLYQLLTDISRRFLNDDIQPAIEKMLEEIGQFAEVDRSYVYILDEAARMWNCLYEWRRAESEKVPSLYYQTGLNAELTPWMLEQFQEGKIIAYEDVQQLPPEAWQCKAVFESDGTLSILLIPIIVNKKVLGFIGYDSVLQRKKWQEDDITALNICTEILTSALIRSEAEKAIKHSLSVNTAIIESIAEGILVTDLDDTVISYNTTFLNMWQLSDVPQPITKARALFYTAMENVENAAEVQEKVRAVSQDMYQNALVTAFMKNQRVIECISKPQVIDGEIVGRVWSSRDITDRILAEREEREKGIAQAQFESLKNQINPHFLFNSLNVLSSLVHLDADLSEKFIDQLARSYRYLLEQKDKELVPLRTEIDFVHAFTFLLKIRFEEKLQVHIQLDATVLQYHIAPLTLQLLIENAVKHNIVSTESPLIIDIFCEDETYLIVRNNLQLRENRMPSTGVGLKNIKSRYKLFTQLEAEFVEQNGHYLARIPLLK